MDKKPRNTIIISIVALVLVLITVTYAYFSARITGIESASTISLTAGRMEIVYTEGNEDILLAQNIYPREEAWATKSFTLTGTNTTNQDMIYTLGLNVEANTFPNDYLTYDLTLVSSTNGIPIGTKTNQPINGTGMVNFGRGKFTNANGDTHNYELKIYFKDNGLNQNDAQNAIFNAKINIDEYIPRRATLLGVNTYDIDYDNCMTFVDERFETTEDKHSFCTGEEAGGEIRNIDDDVAANGDMLEQDGIIENVVRDENDTITSYTINYQKCIDSATENSNWPSDKIEKYCKGENIKFFAESIQNDINRGLEESLINASVIKNITLGPKHLAFGDTYIDGQYTYTFGTNTSYEKHFDGWGVELTDKESTAPVTTEILSYINDKPVVSMIDMFAGSKAASIDLSSINTSNVIYMENMFKNSAVTTLDLSSFDTSNVTTMYGMFMGSATTILNISSFDTSNVTDMHYMFANSAATSLDLSSFDTSNVESLYSMFEGSQATSINLTGFNTSKVNYMARMFQNSKATSLDLHSFDTSKVINMSDMFFNCKASSISLSSFDTSKVTDMSRMFQGTVNLKTLDLSSFNTTNLTNAKQIFWGTAAKTIYVSNNFVTTKLTTNSSHKDMFYNATNLVGGAGTTYSSYYVNKTYARIDGGPSNPGYFTDIASIRPAN